MDQHVYHHEASADVAVAHHFDSPVHQFISSKLGMWLFLATELLMFGGLFCLYAVYRNARPELFTYGSRFLDTPWGVINTVVLILSSLTMAMAVWCAQTNKKRALVAFLAMTLFLGLDFLGIKYIEYSHKFHDNLVWGRGLYEMPEHEALQQRLAQAEDRPTAPTLAPGDFKTGKPLYLQGCLGCHGARGQGLPGLGKPLQTSLLVSSSDDRTLLEFLKVGRAIDDPANTTGITMPPRGGNRRLDDQKLMHIIAFVRTLAQDAAAAPDGAMQAIIMPRTLIPRAAEGPPGLNLRFFKVASSPAISFMRHEQPLSPRLDPARPADLHLFFGIYFLLTGLHGFHVLVGMVVITWLLRRALRGEFSAKYFTPVDLGGLYWHVVDIIWIFLFPLLYLIR